MDVTIKYALLTVLKGLAFDTVTTLFLALIP